MANEYAELAELKDMRNVTNTSKDAALLKRLERASRSIDRRTGRVDGFYQASVVSARTYRTEGRVTPGRDGELLIVDDIATATGLIVEVGDGTTYTAVTDYSTEPENAIARGRAIESLRRTNGTWCWGGWVRVTARWGWPAIPSDITEATLLLANRRFMRKDSPEGVAQWANEGPIRVSRFDPDIEDLVEPYVKPGFGS